MKRFASLRQKLGGWLVGKTGWQAMFARPDSDGPNTKSEFTEPYRQSAWVMRAIKTVSDPIASAERYYHIGEQEVEAPVLDAFWNSPAVALDSWEDFVAAWVGWLKLKGEAFLVMDDSYFLKIPGTAAPSKLILARPDCMTEVVSRGQLVGWRWKDDDHSYHDLLPEQVWQAKLWNPYNQWRGLGEMEAAMLAAETDYLSGKYEGNLSRNSGDQGYVVTTDGGLPSKEQVDQITSQLRRKRDRLLRGEFTDLFLAGGLKVTSPTVTGADAAFQDSRVTKRHEVYAAFGVPPSLADVKASYSFGKDSDYRALIVNTCMPTARKLAATVTAISRRFDGRLLDVGIDFDDHPVMQEVRTERIGAALSLWGMGVPLKDASEYLDMDLPRVPGDDTGYLPFSVQPVNAQLPELDPQFDETADPVQEMIRALRNGTHNNGNGNGQHATPVHVQFIDQPHTCSGYADIETKGADPRWRKKMILRRGTLKQFESRISRVLMEARRETLQKLESYSPPQEPVVYGNNGGVATMLRTLRQKGVAADFVFDLADFTANFFKGMRAVSAQAISTAGNDVWAELGKDDPWSAPPQEVLRYMQNRESKLVDVPADVHRKVADVIQVGFDEGESKAKIAARVRQTFNEFSQGRANTIAQTETTAAYGWGDFRAQKDAGIQWREWLSSGLENVRPTHQDANGTRVRIDEPFKVGGVFLDHPGDPNGPAEEVINCHCVAIAVREGKE